MAVVEDDGRAVQRLRHVEAHDPVQRAQVVVPAERELLPGQRAKVNDVARSVSRATRIGSTRFGKRSALVDYRDAIVILKLFTPVG